MRRGIIVTGSLSLALFVAREAAAAGQTLDVFGEREVLVLLIGFPGAPNTYDPEEMHAGVFGPGRSTDELYREASRGQMWLGGILDPEGDVWGPYEVPTEGCSTFSYSEVSEQALQAAAADGIDVDAYHHRVYAFPPVDSCPGGGIGGGNDVWIFGIGPSAIWDWVGHEAAHGFGFGHASSFVDCTVAGDPITLGGPCVHDEYGDPTDIMGRRNFQFSTWHMERAGWLAPENVAVVEASERVVIAPLESRSDLVQSVRVPRENGEFFHFEYRQPVGFDAGLEPELTGGVLVRIVADPGTRGNPHLLDMTPETPTNDDAALAVGRSFEDGDMRVTVVEANGEHAVLDVILEGIPPDLEPGGGTGSEGGTGTGGTGPEGDGTGETSGVGGTTGFGGTEPGTGTGGDGPEGDDTDGTLPSGADAGSTSGDGGPPEDGGPAEGGAGCSCSAKPTPSRRAAALALFALLALRVRSPRGRAG